MSHIVVGYPAQLRYDLLPGWVEENTRLAEPIRIHERAKPRDDPFFGGHDPDGVAWAQAHAGELLVIGNEPTHYHPLRLLIRQTVFEAMEGELGYEGLSRILGEKHGFDAPFAKTIARTEIRLALGHGAYAGAVCVGMKAKRWLLSNDPGVCSGCAANAAQGWIAIDKPFASGALAPIDHVGCRCDCAYHRNLAGPKPTKKALTNAGLFCE